MKISHLIIVMCQSLSYWLESGKRVEKPYTILQFMLKIMVTQGSVEHFQENLT